MKLLPDLKWSDGSALNADDLMTQYYCSVGRGTIWNYIEKIEKLDDLSVRITFCTESPLVLNISLYVAIMTPDEIYGEYAEKYKAIAENGRAYDQTANMYKMTEDGSAQLATLNEELLSYKPAPNEAVFSGQYIIDKYNSS